LAVIGVLLGVRLSFESRWAAVLQPFVAVLAAPAAYLGFLALARDAGPKWNRTLLWNALPVGLAQICILAPIPVSADVFVLAINSLYLVRMATLLRCGADDFPLIAPHSMRILRPALYATIVLLALMVATDGLIVAISFFAGEPFVMKFLTGVSGVFAAFIFVVALVAGPRVLHRPEHADDRTQAPTDRDRALMQGLDALMAEKQLYRDSDLTLTRLAKRLSVPARDVSAATNRATGENFSRYVNGYRIRHAQRALQETNLPVTEVMYESGFISKSSFNTEFRRATGQTPSQFRASRADA
jgi:AraC-like DNA-binding protein